MRSLINEYLVKKINFDDISFENNLLITTKNTDLSINLTPSTNCYISKYKQTIVYNIVKITINKHVIKCASLILKHINVNDYILYVHDITNCVIVNSLSEILQELKDSINLIVYKNGLVVKTPEHKEYILKTDDILYHKIIKKLN